MPELLLHFSIPFSLSAPILGVRRALIVGFISMLPDIDALLHVHRSMSHSIILLSIIMVVAVSLAYKVDRERRLAAASGLGLISHPLLDLFQSPTPILYPLSQYSYHISPELSVRISEEVVPRFKVIIESEPTRFIRFQSLDAPIFTDVGLITSLLLIGIPLIYSVMARGRVQLLSISIASSPEFNGSEQLSDFSTRERNVSSDVDPEDVTILIPVLNEEEAIGKVISEVKGCGYNNILVVDGYSEDWTVEVARKSGAEVIYQVGHGKAAAIMLPAWYARRIVWPNSSLGAVPAGVVSYKIASVGESLAYLVAGYGLLIPFALMGIRSSGIYYKLAILFLFAAGLSPLIAPKTAIAVWYRFLIGASPIMVPLAFKGASALDSRYLSIYLAVLILPGLCFYMPSGEGHAWKLISAIREFPPSLTPAPASRMLLEDLKELSTFVGRLDRGVPIIVDASTARWIHLSLRDPKPGQIIWSRKDPTLRDVLNYMKRTNQPKVYLVTWKPEGVLLQEFGEDDKSHLQSSLEIRTIRNGIHKIYEIRPQDSGTIC